MSFVKELCFSFDLLILITYLLVRNITLFLIELYKGKCLIEVITILAHYSQKIMTMLNVKHIYLGTIHNCQHYTFQIKKLKPFYHTQLL